MPNETAIGDTMEGVKSLSDLSRILRMLAARSPEGVSDGLADAASQLDLAIGLADQYGDTSLQNLFQAALGNAELGVGMRLERLLAEISGVKDVGKDTHLLAQQTQADIRMFTESSSRQFAELGRSFSEIGETVDQLQSDVGALRTTVDRRFRANEQRLNAYEAIHTAFDQRLATLTDQVQLLSLQAGYIDALPDGLITIDRDGVIMRANPAAEALFGFARGAMVGVSVDTLLPDAQRAAHAKHRAHYFANPQPRAMGHGQAFPAVRHDTGERFAVEIGLSQVLLATGMGALATIRDVSARRAPIAAAEVGGDGDG